MDGEVATQDAIQTGQPSESASSPSEAELKALADAVEEAANKKHSKLDRMLNTTSSERDTYKEQAETYRKQYEEAVAKAEQAERKRLEGDPEALKAYDRIKEAEKRELALKAKEREINETAAKIEAERKTLEQERTGRVVAETAVRYGLPVPELEALQITDPEALDRVARSLASARGGPDRKTDSLVGTGGGTDEDFIKAYARGDSNDHERAQKLLNEL